MQVVFYFTGSNKEDYIFSNKKEEVKSETDMRGNVINIPDFNYLQFEVGSPSGEYKLILKPSDADGSYKIQWSAKLPRK